MNRIGKSWLSFSDLKKPKGIIRPFAPVNVKCVDDSELSIRPIAFNFENNDYEIAEIVDCWYEGGFASGRPPLRYFKVRTFAGEIRFLRFDPVADRWYIIL